MLYRSKTSKQEQQRLSVAYCDGARYEPKLVDTSLNLEPSTLPPSSDRFHLALPETRLIQDLKYCVQDVKSNSNGLAGSQGESLWTKL